MKIMIDMNLSPSWVPFLESNGYTATHWSQTGSISAPDSEIMEWARKHGYVVFTHDLDYGSLLFVTQVIAPSVIQLRSEDVRPSTVGLIVLEALRKAEKAIAQGALVTIDPRKNRIRLLPLKKNNP
jgi:predicted nuclease of predicted toxin-antitoxin system